MAWGDNYRYQARDHDAQAKRLDDEAERLETEADRLQSQLAATHSARRSEDSGPPLIPRHTAGQAPVFPVPVAARRNGIGRPATSGNAAGTVEIADIEEALQRETDPARRRELTHQRTAWYLAQANDPVYSEMADAAFSATTTKAPGIRRLPFLLRTLPVLVVYALLPQIVPALPKAVLNPLGHALATLILAGVIMLTWLSTAVLPRLRNCSLPQALGLGVFVPVVGLIVGILCLVLPEKVPQATD